MLHSGEEAGSCSTLHCYTQERKLEVAAHDNATYTQERKLEIVAHYNATRRRGSWKLQNMTMLHSGEEAESALHH